MLMDLAGQQWLKRELPVMDGLTYTTRLDTNQTQSTIAMLVLKQVQQVRLMHIALGCLSMFLALWVIVRVYWDSWRSHKLSPRNRSSLAFIYDLHQAEVFPLILGYTVFFQELIMVGLQSASMNDLIVTDCNVTSSIIFPTIFALSFMHLVFGAGMTIRALKRFPSKAHYQHATATCLLGFAALVLLSAIPTRITPSQGQCFGDLLLRPLEDRTIGLGIVIFLLIAFVVMAAIIGTSLIKHKNINANERIAGTRMFYYLLISAVLQLFLLPFFVQAVSGGFDQNLTSSRIAEFMLFASGAIIAIIHLILRANSARFAIKPPNTKWQKPRKFRITGPNDLEIMDISPPLNLMNETFSTYRHNEKWDEEESRRARQGYVHSRNSLYQQQPNRFSRRLSRAIAPRWPVPQRHRVSTIHEASEVSPTSLKNRVLSSEFPPDVKEPIQLPASAYTPPTKPQTMFERPQVKEPIRPTAPLKVVDKPLPPRKSSMPARKHSRSDSNDSVTVVSEAFEELHMPTQSWMVGGTRRPSSADSSRTVQIGIILPGLDDVVAPLTKDAPLPRRPRPQPIVAQSPQAPFESQYNTTSAISTNQSMQPQPIRNTPIDDSPQAQFKNYTITSASSARTPQRNFMRRSYSDSGATATAHRRHSRTISDTRPPYLRGNSDIRASNDLWPVGPKDEDFRFSRCNSVMQCGTAEVVMLNPINALDRSKSKRLYKPPMLAGLRRNNSVHAWF